MSRNRQALRLVDDTSRKTRKPKFEADRERPPLQALTPKQGEYIRALNTSEQVIVLGPAGTGKTYIAGTYAADKFLKGEIAKIVITRPNVPGGRSLGFFPGSLEEKIAPWMVALTETLKARMGTGAFDTALKNEDIEIVPFEVMRGRTFKNCIVILDEAQNTTIPEIKMFLTRIGDDCQVILNGDISQSDLKETSGLQKVIHLAKGNMLPIPVIEFGLEDIVRSGICASWIHAFHEAGL